MWVLGRMWLPVVTFVTEHRKHNIQECVVPLGRPRSVYKSNVESRIVSWNGQMTLKVKVNASHFQYQLRESQDAYLVILAHNHQKLSRGQVEIPRILSQNGQNDLEGQSQWPLFSIPTESIPWCMFGANLVIPAQICDELSCGQSKFTDGRT